MTTDLLYNIGPSRDRRVVAREVEALLGEYRPRVLGLVEAIGYPLPRVDGYRLVRDLHPDGRANIALYKRRRFIRPGRWTDLSKTWDRTEYPGTHPARSILRQRLGLRTTVIVAHAPPKTRVGPRDSRDARQEHRDVLVSLIKRDALRRVLLLCDPNAAPDEPVGTATIAHLVGGTYAKNVGNIEGAVARRLTITSARFVTHAGGLRLGSDHGHALVVHTQRRTKEK